MKTNDRAVALTFDDGPHEQHTRELLAILEQHEARATFFMVGEAAERSAALVQAVHRAGHSIGNHSWNHAVFSDLSSHERKQQLRDCEQALAPYGSKLFRPPFGSENFISHWDIVRQGYRSVNWTFDVKDWEAREPSAMAAEMNAQMRPGAIVLLHDSLCSPGSAGFTDRRPTLEAVRLVLQQPSGAFEFVTVPELFRRGRPQTIRLSNARLSLNLA